MKLIIGQRQSGKTTELIREILDNPGPKLVICMSGVAVDRMRSLLLEHADRDGIVESKQNHLIFKVDGATYDILFLTYSQLGVHPVGRMSSPRDIYIDDVEHLMQYLILGSSRVISITATLNDGDGCNIKYLPGPQFMKKHLACPYLEEED